MLKKLVGAALCAFAIVGVGGSVFAGEITGGPNPKPTPAPERARSICAFSGQEDGETLIGFNPDGTPIIVTNTPTGPGYVQNPHQENGAGIIHAPGIPGQACRGNAEGEGGE